MNLTRSIPKKVAVVGAGIFGITTAVELARHGYTVDIFEKNSDILQAASGVNQFRLHRGYHYPRSKETGLESLGAIPLFLKEYRKAVVRSHNHYYAIAKEDSLVSGKEHMRFCKSLGLEFEKAHLPILNSNKIDVCLKVNENLIDPKMLSRVCRKKIRNRRIRLLLNTEFTEKDFENHDYVVLCTYASSNALLNKFAHKQKEYQYELCEKPVVRLPRPFRKKSIVIMDGPFMCVDPLGKSDLFLMGNVVHAIHQTNIGIHPEIDKKFLPLLNSGIVKNPPVTNFDKFIESGRKFIPALAYAEHVGSMFTVRTVLPHHDHTDARPTIVDKIDDKLISVFSGKIANCVLAAREVRTFIQSPQKI